MLLTVSIVSSVLLVIRISQDEDTAFCDDYFLLFRILATLFVWIQFGNMQNVFKLGMCFGRV